MGMRNCQTLTPSILVRIQVPQPYKLLISRYNIFHAMARETRVTAMSRGRAAASGARAAYRHCERGDAIHRRGAPRLDGFVARAPIRWTSCEFSTRWVCPERLRPIAPRRVAARVHKRRPIANIPRRRSAGRRRGASMATFGWRVSHRWPSPWVFPSGVVEAQTRVIGEVAALRGSAAGQSSDSAASTQLAAGDTLTDGETVKTGPTRG